MNQGLERRSGRVRRVLQQRHGPARGLGRAGCWRPPRLTRTPRSSYPRSPPRETRPPCAREPGDDVEVLDPVLGAARRGRLRRPGRRRPSSSVRGARSTRSPAARTSTSASRCGSTISTSCTTNECSWITSARARRRASTTGRGCGPATGSGSSTSGWVTSDAAAARVVRSGSVRAQPGHRAVDGRLDEPLLRHPRQGCVNAPSSSVATAFCEPAAPNRPESCGAGCGHMFHRQAADTLGRVGRRLG